MPGFNDKRLADLLLLVEKKFGELEPIKPVVKNQYFRQLVLSVVSQQLSTKVARVIAGRLEDLVGGAFLPDDVLQTPDDRLREVGLSWSKVSYVKNIADFFASRKVNADLLEEMTDEEIIDLLVQIKGVGRWTAEMFLIFTLARPDVFSVGDYGLRKAVVKHGFLPESAKPTDFLELSANWSPQRSLASRVLWKSLEL